MGSEELEHVVMGEGRRDPAFATCHLGRRPERVQHRLLGRLDRGGEELIEICRGDVARLSASR